MAARKTVTLGADGHPQLLQSGDVLQTPAYTVAQLNAMTGTPAGAKAYASNGRAITGVAALSSGFATQAAGAGTGCLVTWSAAASAWQIAGTNVTVTA